MRLGPIFHALFRRRICLVPTWRGWLVLLAAAAVLGVVLVRSAFPFLAITDSLPGGPLIVEGWVPDDALADAMTEFRQHPYDILLVSGGPIEKGAPLSEFGTWAEVGAATAVKLGFDAARIHAVPAPEVQQDRTYASAVAIREWLRRRGPMPARISVASLGAHSRRTRLLYRAAFDGVAEVGILAIEDRGYDGRRWWTSSQGVRTVIGEMIGYAYARLLFRAPREPALPAPAIP